MTDNLIQISHIINLRDNPDALQLLAYLLHKADKDGNFNLVNNIGISWNMEMSIKRVANGMKILENMQIISELSEGVYHINTLRQPMISELPNLIQPNEYKSFADTFNRKVKDTSIPQIRGLSDTRKKALVSRAKEYGGLAALEHILDKVVASDFLSGRKTDFCATFDWIFKKANFIKIIEGNYDNKFATASQRTDGSQIDRYSALAAAAGAVIRRNTTVYPAGDD